MKTKHAQLGSVSTATMRPEDLIPRFLDTLANLAGVADTLRTPDQEKIAQTVREIEGRMEAEDYYESEESDYDLEELFNALGEFAPPFCYFGASEGDGADYGFWISWDSLKDSVRDGSVVKLKAGAEYVHEDESVEYVLTETDHGNVTLYGVPTMEEIWSVV
jgi:hypothetical protein